uniref:Uncharacterized protein n=1 Tax=Anopheles merus TaxID=30066 RepID=A0A182VB55_ANOME
MKQILSNWGHTSKMMVVVSISIPVSVHAVGSGKAPMVRKTTGRMVLLHDGRLHRSVGSVKRCVRRVQMCSMQGSRWQAGRIFLHDRRPMGAPVAVRTGGVAIVVASIRCGIGWRSVRERRIVIVVVGTGIVDGVRRVCELGVRCADVSGLDHTHSSH